MTITLQAIDKDNIEQAIDIGVRIFGEVDREGISEEFRASAGFRKELDSIEGDLHITEPHYFIFCNDGVPSGVIGDYKIKDHEEDAWLGWFGILPERRGAGIARTVIMEAFNAACRPGVKTIRGYSTLEAKHKTACDLYRRMGFVEEAYRPGAEDAASMIRVFSKSVDMTPPAAECMWENAAYPIDCDKFVIPEMNEYLGFNDRKKGDIPPAPPQP